MTDEERPPASESTSPEQAPPAQAPPALKAEERKCRWCLDTIPNKAVVCRQCRNYQGWRYVVRLIFLSIPLISAAAAFSVYAARTIGDAYTPFGKKVSISSTWDGGNDVIFNIFNYGLKDDYVDGSFFYCMGDKSHYRENTGSSLRGSKIAASAETTLKVHISDQAVARAGKYECKISMALVDYHGGADIWALPVAPLSFVVK